MAKALRISKSPLEPASHHIGGLHLMRENVASAKPNP